MVSMKLFIVVGMCVAFAVHTNADCTYNGQTYTIGQSYYPTPCEHCHCTATGKPLCLITDCFFTQCVDSVHDPTKCCRQCPNGANCQHADGTIIKKGDMYRPNSSTVCSCPQNLFGLHGTRALCVVKPPDQTIP